MLSMDRIALFLGSIFIQQIAMYLMELVKPELVEPDRNYKQKFNTYIMTPAILSYEEYIFFLQIINLDLTTPWNYGE